MTHKKLFQLRVFLFYLEWILVNCVERNVTQMNNVTHAINNTVIRNSSTRANHFTNSPQQAVVIVTKENHTKHTLKSLTRTKPLMMMSTKASNSTHSSTMKNHGLLKVTTVLEKMVTNKIRTHTGRNMTQGGMKVITASSNHTNKKTIQKIKTEISSSPSHAREIIKKPNTTSSTHMPKLICKGMKWPRSKKSIVNSTCHSRHEDPLACFQDPLYCEHSFISGKREILRPVYGEYDYLPHEKVLRHIQAGGVAFLYHPCTHDRLVSNLRLLAESCLHRFILAPYEKLTRNEPIALVTWGCYMRMSSINTTLCKTWLKLHAMKGPASHVHTNGKFKGGIVKPASMLTDKKDTIICPNEKQLNQFESMGTQGPTKPDPERIINKRLYMAQHKRDQIKVATNVTVTAINGSNAAWAVSSLVFILGILIGLMLYTRLWRPNNQPRSGYNYDKLGGEDEEGQYESAHSDFSILKSRQRFVNVFRHQSKRERRMDTLSSVKLMSPIVEDEDEDVIFSK